MTMTVRPADSIDNAPAVETLRRIRDEASALRHSGSAVAPTPPAFSAPVLAPLPEPRSPTAGNRKKHSLRDLMQLQHVAFVTAAYEAILGRPPDAQGLQGALQWLASGGSKIRVLCGLRYSDEGRLRKTRLRGLAWRCAVERMFRIPILGYLLQIVVAMVRLPAGVRHHRALEFAMAAQDAQNQAAIGTLAQALRRDVQSLTEATETAFGSHGGAQEAMRQRLEQVARTVDASVASLEAAAQQAALEAARMDAFYAEFEHVFRGSREEIKARVAVYLPVLEEAGVGDSARPVLDLGCGRGEWLEALKERGLTGRGVDRSGIACADCRERGLEVVQADALAYLMTLPDACLGAVTGMHIVEHLPFEALLELVGQCVRLLQPGGLLILETPNPSNLLVTTNTFYLDPTHRHPVPAALLKFLMESRGLTRVDVRELHPSAHQWGDIESEMDRYLVANLFGGQDYAAIGRKPGMERNASQAMPNQ